MCSMSQTVLKKWFHNVKYTVLHISIWGNKQDILPWFLFSFPLVLSWDPPLVFSYFSWAFHHDLIQNIENGITAKGIWRSARVHMSAACSSLSCGWSCPLIFSPLIVWGQVYVNTVSQPGPETLYGCKALVWPVSFKLDICTLGCPVDWWWLDTEQGCVLSPVLWPSDELWGLCSGCQLGNSQPFGHWTGNTIFPLPSSSSPPGPLGSSGWGQWQSGFGAWKWAAMASVSWS